MHWGRNGRDLTRCSAPAGDCTDNKEWLGSRCDRLRQRGIYWCVGDIFLTGEESHERSALLSEVIAEGSPQLWMDRLQCIENGPHRYRSLHVEADLAAHVCERAQMLREHNTNGGGANHWATKIY